MSLCGVDEVGYDVERWKKGYGGWFRGMLARYETCERHGRGARQVNLERAI